VGFAAIAICVASQRVFSVVDFDIDSVQELLDTSSYNRLSAGSEYGDERLDS
jgi:hypothetical protein